eukprot:UN26919
MVEYGQNFIKSFKILCKTLPTPVTLVIRFLNSASSQWEDLHGRDSLPGRLCSRLIVAIFKRNISKISEALFTNGFQKWITQHRWLSFYNSPVVNTEFYL